MEPDTGPGKATLLKEEGNRYFGQNDFVRAEALYTKAYVNAIIASS